MRLVIYLIEYLGEFEFICETVLDYESRDQMGSFEAKKTKSKSHAWAPLIRQETCRLHRKSPNGNKKLMLDGSRNISGYWSEYPQKRFFVSFYDNDILPFLLRSLDSAQLLPGQATGVQTANVSRFKISRLYSMCCFYHPWTQATEVSSLWCTSLYIHTYVHVYCVQSSTVHTLGTPKFWRFLDDQKSAISDPKL
jgi:hypothetical protein